MKHALFILCFLLASASANVCDLDSIYQSPPGYSYSLPKEVLQSFLSGKAFDHPRNYTPEESAGLHADILDLFQQVIPSEPPFGKEAVISAGAPGVGKTTLFKQKLAQSPRPFVSPDEVCLKGLTRTYVRDIESGDGSFASREAAYVKWRPASNAATHLLLAHLIRDQYPFCFESTCSSPQTHKFFQFLKDEGYHIKVIHISASDEVRWKSIQERDKTFIQTSKEDIYEKGLLVPQRIDDTFLSHADEIDFYYRPTATSDAIHAATWIKPGALLLFDKEAYQKLKAVHNLAIEKLKLAHLTWENTVEKNHY